MKKSDYVAMRTAVIKGRGMGWDIIDVKYIEDDLDNDQSIVNDGRVVSVVRMAIGAGSAGSGGSGCRHMEEYGCDMRLEITFNGYSDSALVTPVAVMEDEKSIALVSAGWATIESYLKFLDSYSCVVDIEDSVWQSSWERNSSARTQLEDFVREEKRLRAEAEARAAEEADQLEFLSLIAAFEAKAE